MSVLPEPLPHYALLVAGGSGSRMHSALPKQFLMLAGKPVLQHAAEQFLAYSTAVKLIICLPQAHLAYWQQYHAAALPPEVRLVAGGATRFQSVRNGLACIQPGLGLVAVHDGVRPLVPVSVIAECYRVAQAHGAAVAAVPCKDSVRQLGPNGRSHSLNRSTLRLVQTPQTFQVDLLKKAFLQPESDLFTDDASVAEAAGIAVRLVEGAYTNLKITTPEDLLLAESLLAR